MHLRELWGARLGVAISFALGLLAALWSVGTISLSPPGIQSRTVQMAAASTRVLVDTPTSSMLDLSVSTLDITSMTNRALLVSNVMASEPVREYIARRADLPAEVLRVASPVTRDWPRQLAQSGSPKKTSDIFKSPNEYRLSLKANPTVPVVDIYAQAPTEAQARELANGAVTGMRDYLRDIAARQGIPSTQQVHLQQLGGARGGVVNPGVRTRLALLAFVLVFGISCLATIFLGRVRRGWSAGPDHGALHPTARRA
ncbi:MAG: hypothetical protein ACRDLN_09275 [Solirubrobacteraceae bacterium]